MRKASRQNGLRRRGSVEMSMGLGIVVVTMLLLLALFLLLLLLLLPLRLRRHHQSLKLILYPCSVALCILKLCFLACTTTRCFGLGRRCRRRGTVPVLGWPVLRLWRVRGRRGWRISFPACTVIASLLLMTWDMVVTEVRRWHVEIAMMRTSSSSGRRKKVLLVPPLLILGRSVERRRPGRLLQ